MGFGAHRLSQVAYKMSEPQIFEDATQTVAPGETLALSYRDVGQQCNYVPWNGTVEMTIQRIVLYPSYTAAKNAGEAAGNPNGLLHSEEDPFLILDIEVTNIDAEEGDYAWRNQTISNSDGAITLQQDFQLYSSTAFNHTGSYLFPALWCVNGETSSDYSARTDIPQGETAHVILGFSLEEGAEERLDGAALIYNSIFDRMDIGSPTLGGEADGAVSH